MVKKKLKKKSLKRAKINKMSRSKRPAKKMLKKLKPVLELRSESEAERRVNPRLPICARVLWGREERYFFSRDLSASGAFLLTDHPPAINEVVEIQFSVQFVPEPIHCFAKVVRHEENAGRATGFGVEFVEVHPQLRSTLARIHQSMTN